jgi:TolB protein
MRFRKFLWVLAAIVVLLSLKTSGAQGQATASQLAFTTVLEGVAKVYLVNQDGTDVRQVTPDDAWYIASAWSPDGTRLTGVKTDPASDTGFGARASSIYVLDLAANTMTTFGGEGQSNSLIYPVWSADGSRILFGSYVEAIGCLENVYTAAPDGSNITRFYQNCSFMNSLAYVVDWSRNGDYLAYSIESGLDTTLYILPVASIQVDSAGHLTGTPISFGLADGYQWSPDGTRLVFRANPTGERPYLEAQIFVVNADGTGLTQLTRDAGPKNRPIWSPDGSQITYVEETIRPSRIIVMSADGSNPTAVAEFPGRIDELAWSPNGVHLAVAGVFLGEDDTLDDLFLIPVSGGEMIRVTHDEAKEGLLRWQPLPTTN